MEFAFLFILSLVLIFYNNWLRRDSNDYTEPKPQISQPKPVKKVDKIVLEKKEEKNKEFNFIPEIKEVKIKRKLTDNDIPKVKNVKDLLINSFRDGKDLKNVHIYNEGKIILASDVKLY